MDFPSWHSGATPHGGASVKEQEPPWARAQQLPLPGLQSTGSTAAVHRLSRALRRVDAPRSGDGTMSPVLSLTLNH